MTANILQIIIGIVLTIIAFKFVKKLTKLAFYLLLGIAIYCFAKGIIDIAMIQEWWTTIVN